MPPRSRATVTGRIKEPQTLSFPVSRWGYRLLVAHQRNSIFSELSIFMPDLGEEKNIHARLMQALPDNVHLLVIVLSWLWIGLRPTSSFERSRTASPCVGL